MRNFNIKVNGKSYVVSVEELEGGVSASAPTVTSAQAAPATPATAPAPEAPKAAASKAPGAGEQVKAPMPGTILDIKVKEGDSVKAGQAIVVLEAMKMENDIVTPIDGTVSSILVKKGDSVETSDILVTVA